MEYLDDYEVVELLHRNAETQTLHVIHRNTKQKFIIKLLFSGKKTEQPALRWNRIHRDTEFAGSFDHPNISRPVDIYFDEEKTLVVYPFIPGTTLDKLVADGKKLPVEYALDITKQLLETLAHIHNQGIVHADINIATMFITGENGLKLLDFGYSLTEDDIGKVSEGMVFGTFPFLSPEQMGFTGFKIDNRSDLYCAGIVLYRLLAGALPFDMPNMSTKELLNASLNKDIVILKNVSRNINGILLKALRPSPAERYQTAEGFIFDINRCIEMSNNGLEQKMTIGKMDVPFSVSRKRLFIERGKEIESLNNGLRRLDNHQGRYFLFYGRSGVGKTELIREFRKGVTAETYHFLSAKCNRLTPALPYSILKKLLADFLVQIEKLNGDAQKKFIDTVRSELWDVSGIICDYMPDLRRWFNTVADVDRIEKDRESDRIINVFVSLLSVLSRLRRIILFIDDFQWVDRVTFDVVMRIIECNMDCMLICNFRTGIDEDSLLCNNIDLRNSHFSVVNRIAPFSHRETVELIRARFSQFDDCEELSDILFSRTDGNPFVISEAIRFLVEKSILYFDGGTWNFRREELADMKGKFDPVSMIMDKFLSLGETERKVLEMASVIEGRFDEVILSTVNGMPLDKNRTILYVLEHAGFIVSRLKKGYLFVHDKVQEAIVNKIASDDKYEYNERLGNYYLRKSNDEKEHIFHAAEYYLKSRNYTAAVDACYRAALYATETNALDTAIKYFKNTRVIYKFAEKEGVAPSIDFVNIDMGYGKVLMLSGANMQALNTFNMILETMKVSDIQRLEIRYTIGSIHHNLGEFEESIPCFMSIMDEMGCRIPSVGSVTFFSIAKELAVQLAFSLGLKHLIRKRNDRYSLIKSRVLFKLSYSLYFIDMPLAFLVHFKSLNLADTLSDCYEKSEVYASHQVPVYQIMLRHRAFRYCDKAMAIAEKVRRMDNIAFARSFGGLVRYYHAEWKKSLSMLTSSMKIYRSIGDVNNQIISSEHLWKIKMMTGDLDDTYDELNSTIEMCKRVNEKYYLTVSVAALELVTLRRNGKFDSGRIQEIEKQLKILDSVLLHIEAGGYMLSCEIESGEYQKAYERAVRVKNLILKNSINSEYQVRILSVFGDLICRELRNRRNDFRTIHIDERILKREFLSSSLVHWFSCLNYPAYWGSWYRNVAWFLAVRGHKRTAAWFFRKAIKSHHKLDMRYEEGCSIRDFGLFLDDFCNLPGYARDRYIEARRIFEWCHAKPESINLAERIGIGIMESEECSASHDVDLDSEEDTSPPPLDINSFRFDTLVEVGKTITETSDISILLRQILSAMITVSGAQYGCFFINKNTCQGYEPIAMSFEGRDVSVEDVPVFHDLINMVNEIHTLSCDGQTAEFEGDIGDSSAIRSDLCIPLNWCDKYLGYVYLVNDRVRGLFGDGAQKAAMILAAHAGILLENANLMNRQKLFNEELKKQVATQTDDLKKKHQQLEEANLKLIESERMKGILSGTVVHDIKNYTAGITGNLLYLSRYLKSDVKVNRIIDIVCETCSDITNLASNLLDIAKMDEGKMVVREEPLDCLFFETMAEKFGKSALFEEKEITTRIIPPTGPFVVFADVYLMERVLQNLYSNASKYAPRRSTVELQLYDDGLEYMICFYNSGPPIPDSEKDILFDKYARLQNRQSPYSKGLGLFFCKMVLQAHGGKIWLDTDQSGNYFKIAFPRRTAVGVTDAAVSNRMETIEGSAI